MNMGYPLLDEESIVNIASGNVAPRDDHAANDIDNWMNMEKPTPGYQERCYYHTMKTVKGHASVFQPKHNVGVSIDYDSTELDCFVEWKMMGVRDYVLGLEPGNATPDGRNICREKGMLKFLKPGEKKVYSITIKLIEE